MRLTIEQELMHATISDDILNMRAALAVGANPNCHDAHGRTPLMWACMNSSYQAFHLLLCNKASIASFDLMGNDAAFYARKSGNRLIQLAIESTIDNLGASFQKRIDSERSVSRESSMSIG